MVVVLVPPLLGVTVIPFCTCLALWSLSCPLPIPLRGGDVEGSVATALFIYTATSASARDAKAALTPR